MTVEKTRTLLLGVGGVPCPRLLEWAKTGELPFLAGILREGVSGPLEPAIPAYFSVAWADWLSGRNPGHHGFFGPGNKIEIRKSIENTLAGGECSSVIFNLPPALTIAPGAGQEIFPGESDQRQNDWQKIERWGKTFCSLWEKKDWDFFAAAIDFSPSTTVTPDESSLLALVKSWDTNLDQTLSSYGHELNILVLSTALPLKPKNFSLEKILEAEGFLKKQGHKTDPASSLAYPLGEGEIKINLKGRETGGKVEPGREYEELRDKIIQTLDKYNPAGMPPVLKIYKKEELFSGEYLESAPDLLLEFAPGKNQGLFMAKGSPFVRAQETGPLRGIDIAPTILYVRGQEIPSTLEGRIIKEAFTPDFWRLNLPQVKTPAETLKTLPEVSPEKLERIIERLKGLGYLT